MLQALFPSAFPVSFCWIVFLVNFVSLLCRENSPSKVISIRPTCNIGINYQNPMFLAQTPGRWWLFGLIQFIFIFNDGQVLQWMLIVLSNDNNIFMKSNFAVDFINSEMTVPEALVGGLIGKGGYNITRIRNESGATIKVCSEYLWACCPNYLGFWKTHVVPFSCWGLSSLQVISCPVQSAIGDLPCARCLLFSSFLICRIWLLFPTEPLFHLYWSVR